MGLSSLERKEWKSKRKREPRRRCIPGMNSTSRGKLEFAGQRDEKRWSEKPYLDQRRLGEGEAMEL